MIKKLSGLKKLGLLAMLPFMFGFNADAKEKHNMTAYWSGPMGGSYHFNREKEVNENNGIWGLGIQLNKDWEVYWKRCINSQGHLTNWIGTELKLYSNKLVDLGAEGFIVDGYPQNDYKFAPGIAGVAKFKYGDWGIKIHMPPPREYSSDLMGLKSLENLEVIIWNFTYDIKF